MKKILIGLLAGLLVFSFSVPCQAGKLRKGWTTAKKSASKELKNAKLKKLSKYVKFDKGFGPALDKLEKMAAKAPANISLKKALKDKKLMKAFKKYCAKMYINDEYLYLTKGYKMKPKKVWDTFTNPGSKHSLNIDSKETAAWRACSESGNWKPCKAMRKTTYNTVFGYTRSDHEGQFQNWLKKNPEENPGYKDPEPLKKEVLAICKDYKGQIKKMDKKAKAASDILIKELKKIKNSVKTM